MNKLFHRGYFAEIFRQLKVAGIVGAGVLMANNISSFFMVLTGSSDIFNSAIPSGSMLMLPMLSYVYIMGLVLTFSAFGWLNKRSSCDFYHAIPVTRKQMYFSSVAAVLCWLFIGLSAYAAVHAIIYALTGSPFNYVLYLCVFVNMIIGCFEVVGAVSIACAVSGTRFVNFFASIVIMFMPRLMLTVLAAFTATIDDSLVIGTVSPLFDPSFNIAACPYGILLSELGMSLRFDNLLAWLYSFVYALILIVLGSVAFNKRKSEMAGIPAGRGLQAAVRTAIGMPLLLILDLVVFTRSDYPNNFPNFEGTFIIALLLILFSFIFYSLYELISTKSAKKMAKAMPLFSICICIGLLYLVVPIIITKIESAIEIKPENIKSFSVNTNHNGGLADIIDRESFGDIESRKLTYEDENGKKIVASAYNRARNNGRSGDIFVTINRKFGRPITRMVSFPENEYSVFMGLITNDTRYVKAYNSLPDGRNYYSIAGLSKAETKRIADTFIEEYNSLSDDAKSEIYMYGSGFGYYEGESATLTLYGCKGADNYTQNYRINQNTPKTSALYYEIVNSKMIPKCKAVLESFKSMMEETNEIDWAQIELHGEVEMSINNWAFEKTYSSAPPDSKGTYAERYPEVYELISILCKGTPTTDFTNALSVVAEGSGAVDTSDYFEVFYSGRMPALLGFTPEQFDRIKELYAVISEKYNGMFNNGQYPYVEDEDLGSFTMDDTYSYDGKYYAFTVMPLDEPDALVTVCSCETDETVYTFTPARSSDFWGICWEGDSYNIWIQSGDIGCVCYKYADGEWILDENAVRPDYIISRYD